MISDKNMLVLRGRVHKHYSKNLGSYVILLDVLPAVHVLSLKAMHFFFFFGRKNQCIDRRRERERKKDKRER